MVGILEIGNEESNEYSNKYLPSKSSQLFCPIRWQHLYFICTLEFMVKPVMAIRRLMAKASCHRVCHFRHQKEKKNIGEFLLLGHSCTRANDKKSLIK
jgi:hypothetical protein